MMVRYQAGVNELELAEAPSLAMFSGSLPHYVRAAEVSRPLTVEGTVRASDIFQQRAEISG